MSPLEQALADYLRLRRSLGHELAEAGWLLPGFVAYLDDRGAQTVTVEAALSWAQQAPKSPTGQVSSVGPRRMTAARGFAGYLAGIDASTEVPPLGLMPHRARWRRPFIYSPADIDALLALSRQSIVSPLRAATYQTLIGLLAASGLRIGEAIKLDRADIDWTQGVLLIRESKFGKSRMVPLHPSSMQVLGDYAVLRDELQPRPKDLSFFVSLKRKRLLYAVVQQTFRRLVDTAGIGADAPCPPRLHDLRHTFAVRTLLGWYRADQDVQAQMPSLSTYLGHREPACTYWYLSAAPELLALAAARQDSVLRLVEGAVMTLIAPTLQAFFTDRLAQQRQASPRTIAAYRDTLRLLLTFVHARTGKLPAQLEWDHLGATTISAFLNHLESDRHNSTRTRNVRLTAIRSLFSYAALRHPEHALLIQRVLAIPPKRFDKRSVTFLTAAEIDALIAAPD